MRFVVLLFVVLFCTKAPGRQIDDRDEIYARAKRSYEKKEYAQAITDFDAVIKLEPDDGWAFYLRGKCRLERQELEQAAADFDVAARVQPYTTEFHLQRVALRRKQGKLDLVIAAYDDLIVADPENAEFRFDRGNLHRETGDLKRAMSDFGEASWLEPGNVKYARVCGVARYEAKAYLAAYFDFSRAIQFAPDAALYYSRALALHELNEYEQALADLDECLRLDPKHTEALSRQAWIKATCRDEKLRNGELAVKNATRACELTEWKHAHMLDALAAAEAEVGNFDLAAKWMTKALQLAPTSERESYKSRLVLYQAGKAYRDEVKR